MASLDDGSRAAATVTLTERGRAWAEQNRVESIVARVALGGIEWPLPHYLAAVRACNEKGAEDHACSAYAREAERFPEFERDTDDPATCESCHSREDVRPVDVGAIILDLCAECRRASDRETESLEYAADEDDPPL